MEYLQWMADPQAWLALLTLTFLEIVLGIDNIIFIVVLVSKLPKEQQKSARILGMGFAMFTRIALLCSLFWIMKLVKPLFSIGPIEFSGRDLILIVGGIFLIWKSGGELLHMIRHDVTEGNKPKAHAAFFGTIIEIGLLDIVFSLDSVITAVGMAKDLEVMIIAIVISVFIMMFASDYIGRFIDKHPSIKTLALAFLLLIGVTLIADGFGYHIDKAYVYFAIGFSLFVALLNIKIADGVKKSS